MVLNKFWRTDASPFLCCVVVIVLVVVVVVVVIVLVVVVVIVITVLKTPHIQLVILLR